MAKDTQLALPLGYREPSAATNHSFRVLFRDELETLVATRYGPTCVCVKNLKVV